ncbi:hypothetical protein AB0G74_05710 [Streptomyces sp. NPDC020875]|uniref:hypothetical protein n=1 Tax=Streptomyces sp. NPDC020875 TaxID=3154898 RepID=UPI0033FFF316
MQSTALRRGAVAASAVSLALLLSACGGDKKDDSKSSNGAKDDTKKSAPAKTQAELDKLAIVSADLKATKVTTPPAADLKGAESATADKAECTPLTRTVAGLTPGDPAARISRGISQGLEPPKTGTPEEQAQAAIDALKDVSLSQLALASYEGDGATKAMAELKKSAEACTAGFGVTINSDSNKVTKVAPATFTGGDEALAYILTMGTGDEAMRMPLVVVRKGNEIVSVVDLNVDGEPDLPKTTIDAQLKKLG